MKFRRTSGKTVVRDLCALADFLSGCPYKERVRVAKWLNDSLDEMLEDDFFGTEGQCDPRGDHRD